MVRFRLGRDELRERRLAKEPPPPKRGDYSMRGLADPACYNPPMPADEIIRHLQLTHFLRGLSDDRLRQLADELELQQYEPGQMLQARGESVDGLRLLLSGRVEVLTQDRDGSLQVLTEDESGAALGAYELLRATTASAAIRAQEPTTVLFWPKRSLFRFLESHPTALASLQLSAESQALARQLRFGWLGDQEAIFAMGRRHPAQLVFRLTLPFVMFFVGIGLLWWGNLAGWYAWAGALAVVAALLYGLWQWIDWRNDYFVVTDQRVVWLEKVVAIYDSRLEAPLHQVLAASITTDVMGRWLGYGDVTVKTYTGQIRLPHIARPKAVAAVVEERWRRLQLNSRQEDRADKTTAVRQLLDGEQAVQAESKAVPAGLTETAGEERQEPEVGLNHWNFELRFEERGVITYRKHWAVLLGMLALPSFVLLLLVGLIGGNLGGLLHWFDLPATLLLGGLGLLLAGSWWAYQFADWANDIYQVSPTHILDVYRRPLGRELRRAAPLENILSTEVDRRGLIGLLLDFGDVRVNVGAEQLDFEGVFHPGDVQQDIARAQEAFMAGQRAAREKQQRDEMVEWLGAYHEEIASRKPTAQDDQELDVYP